MGWDVHLTHEDGTYVNVPHRAWKGSHKILYKKGETPDYSDASLKITFNYREHYTLIFGEEALMWLYGKKAKDTIDKLKAGVEILGVVIDEDYWKSTPGNAGYWLSVMLDWAKQYPEAIWKVYP